MKKREVLPNIYLVEFPTSEEAAKTFMRFQEHYESPKFRNKIFTVEQYKKWYVSYTKRPKFSYYQDWSGFNIPSYVLLPFYSGAFKGLTKRERQFLDLFRNCTGQYYIIGIQKGNKRTLKHELMHRLYYTNTSYRSRVDEILKLGPTAIKDVEKYIKNLGYHNEVLRDEVHAYLATCGEDLEAIGINMSMFERWIKMLNDNFRKHSKEKK
jgi:hypothetical protein